MVRKTWNEFMASAKPEISLNPLINGLSSVKGNLCFFQVHQVNKKTMSWNLSKQSSFVTLRGDRLSDGAIDIQPFPQPTQKQSCPWRWNQGACSNLHRKWRTSLLSSGIKMLGSPSLSTSSSSSRHILLKQKRQTHHVWLPRNCRKTEI